MLKILIVDDEPIIQHGIISMIDNTRFHHPQIKAVNNGEKALEIINSWHPYLVFMDIKMPLLDGLHTIEKLDLSAPDSPIVIMLTNYNDFEYVRSAMRLGAFDYLIKVELSVELINQTIANALSLNRKNDNIPITTDNDHLYQSQINHFYTKLVYGYFDTLEAITNVMNQLHLRFECNYYYAVYFDLIPQKQQLTQFPNTNAIHYIHLLLQRSFGTDDEYGYVLPLEKQSNFLVLSGIDSETDFPPLNIINHCLTMIYRYTNLSFAAGIGRIITTLEHFPTTFNESLLSFEQCTEDSPIVLFNSSFSKKNPLPNNLVQEPYPINYHTQVLIPKIISYIENHYTEPLSLKLIANTFQLSSSYLSTLFNKYTGTNFSDYVNQIKINHAKELLQNNSITLQELAEILGYTDPYYFSRVFKKIEGMSVREYLTQNSP